MLTKKQTKAMDRVVNDYRKGLMRALKISRPLADRYANRYRRELMQAVERQGTR